MHAGIDVGAPRGATVYAPRPGTVAMVGRDSDGRGRGLHGYGNAVVIHHNDENVYSFYAHMARVFVNVGDFLEPGQPIGTVGNTSNGKFPGMGRHLHMEVRRPRADGSSPYPGGYGVYNIDPAVWLAGHGIGFERRDLVVDPELEACASPTRRVLEVLVRGGYASPAAVDSPSRRRLFTRNTAGLGAAKLGDVTEDANADYEPVMPEPGWTKPMKPIIKALVPATLIGVGLVGIGLTLDSFNR